MAERAEVKVEDILGPQGHSGDQTNSNNSSVSEIDLLRHFVDVRIS